MKYRTIEGSTEVSLRKERRSAVQFNTFPIEDLQGNIIHEDRRTETAEVVEGVEITETNISQAEFQEYFEKQET